ncbi:heavy metal sensor histidine kinase [Cellvibrio polysaccharolyticus]|uniref:Sensor protein n=1 Tax=Cellvibrio polysaccharolyticus TaxID=2082724 RepID=A0A928UZY7_9GAMM|nr:heavy metal sensor histidine kinase [Cellvibrio polysaccharolyticus]MBE8715777.1 HAMP domain-containing protein [Cellvibrio polysaccharolyticus]
MIKRSISARLALMFVLASVVIVATCALLLRYSLHDSLRKQMYSELQYRHSLVRPYLLARTDLDEWHTVNGKFTDLSNAEGGRVQYWIVGDERYQVGGPPPEGVNWENLATGFSRVAGPDNDCSIYLLSIDLPAQGVRPVLRYVIAIDSTPYMDTLAAFTRVLIVVSLVGAVLVALLSFAIARIGMRPINYLSRQAHNLVPGNAGQRLDQTTLPIELQTLAESFNGVLARQEIAWRQLESFNADVAHELRTPLTNLIGQTQLGLSRKRDVHELEELLQSNLEELERMTAIVNDMLFLSHAQAGEHATQLTQVSLREESIKTAEYVEPSFAERQLTVQIDGDVNACIDRRLFHRALANLLENSARYAWQSTRVTVTLKQEKEFALVCVANFGEKIEEQHLVRLFERFYRVDTSRVRSDIQHGLGLSIVRAVALMHHGEVFATSHDGVNTFGFSLLIDPPKASHT